MKPKFHQKFTFSEFIAELKKPAHPLCRKRSSRDGDHSWAGGSFTKALSMLKNGWPEGAAKIDKMTANTSKSTRTAYTEESQLIPSETGCDFDIDAYMQGEPECMLDFGAEFIEKPIIKIGAQLNLNCNLNSTHAFSRGAAFLSLIMALEFAGYGVELIGFYYWESRDRGPSTGCLSEIELKKSNEPLDIDTLAYAMGHVSFTRRLIFSAMESHPEAWYIQMITSQCYGRARSLPAEFHDYDICPDYKPNSFSTPENAKLWIAEMAKKAGITLTK